MYEPEVLPANSHTSRHTSKTQERRAMSCSERSHVYPIHGGNNKWPGPTSFAGARHWHGIVKALPFKLNSAVSQQMTDDAGSFPAPHSFSLRLLEIILRKCHLWPRRWVINTWHLRRRRILPISFLLTRTPAGVFGAALRFLANWQCGFGDTSYRGGAGCCAVAGLETTDCHQGRLLKRRRMSWLFRAHGAG